MIPPVVGIFLYLFKIFCLFHFLHVFFFFVSVKTNSTGQFTQKFFCSWNIGLYTAHGTTWRAQVKDGFDARFPSLAHSKQKKRGGGGKEQDSVCQWIMIFVADWLSRKPYSVIFGEILFHSAHKTCLEGIFSTYSGHGMAQVHNCTAVSLVWPRLLPRF